MTDREVAMYADPIDCSWARGPRTIVEPITSCVSVVVIQVHLYRII